MTGEPQPGVSRPRAGSGPMHASFSLGRWAGVVLEGGRLVGLLSMTDVSRLIELRSGSGSGRSDAPTLAGAAPLRQ
jgi:hypothetical protein